MDNQAIFIISFSQLHYVSSRVSGMLSSPLHDPVFTRNRGILNLVFAKAMFLLLLFNNSLINMKLYHNSRPVVGRNNVLNLCFQSKSSTSSSMSSTVATPSTYLQLLCTRSLLHFCQVGITTL